MTSEKTPAIILGDSGYGLVKNPKGYSLYKWIPEHIGVRGMYAGKSIRGRWAPCHIYADTIEYALSIVLSLMIHEKVHADNFEEIRKQINAIIADVEELRDSLTATRTTSRR
jgi:hypothetical protein